MDWYETNSTVAWTIDRDGILKYSEFMSRQDFQSCTIHFG